MTFHFHFYCTERTLIIHSLSLFSIIIFLSLYYFLLLTFHFHFCCMPRGSHTTCPCNCFLTISFITLKSHTLHVVLSFPRYCFCYTSLFVLLRGTPTQIFYIFKLFSDYSFITLVSQFTHPLCMHVLLWFSQYIFHSCRQFSYTTYLYIFKLFHYHNFFHYSHISSLVLIRT